MPFGSNHEKGILSFIRAAGFQRVNILEETPFSIKFMKNDLTTKAILGNLKISLEKVSQIESSVSSIKVYAIKPNDASSVDK